MRWFIPVLLAVLLPSPALAGGGLDAGGGVRTGDAITVHDVLGAPMGGLSGAGATVVGSGLLYGISIPTAITLVSLQITTADGAVMISWSAPDDAGILGFHIERANGAERTEGESFVPLDARFTGPGPHSYRDSDVTPGASYRYRLIAALRTGEQETLGPWPVSLDESQPVTVLRVLPARPNPFRGAFELAFTLPRDADVAWRLYDVRGALIAAKDLGRKPAGTHASTVRAPQGLASGLYFLEVQAGSLRDVQKVMMLP